VITFVLHIVVTVLMVIAALLQLAVFRDPLAPNFRAMGSFRILLMAGFLGLAFRLVQMGFNRYIPPISGSGLISLLLLAVGHIGMQIDRLSTRWNGAPRTRIRKRKAS
jgi:hypothetical protein